MKNFKILILALAIPFIFSCSEGEEEINFCTCMENALKEKMDEELDKKCEEKYKDLTKEELMAEMEKCDEKETEE